MTKRKTNEPQAPPLPRLNVEWVTLEFLSDLRDNVRRLREDVAFYRGKCERLELSIMNSETKAEARIEFVERTDPGLPSIRNAQAPRREPVGFKTKFKTLQEKWDAMTPAEQAAAIGEKETEPAEPAKQ